MRRNALIMALAVLLIAGVVANFSLGSSTHIRDEITLQPGGIASEFIPGGHSVRGRVSPTALSHSTSLPRTRTASTTLTSTVRL